VIADAEDFVREPFNADIHGGSPICEISPITQCRSTKAPELEWFLRRKLITQIILLGFEAAQLSRIMAAGR